MQIRVNEQLITVNTAVTVGELVVQYKPDANLYIVDGNTVDSSFIVTRENTNVVLIKKGVIPSEAELEAMLVGRHSRTVHEAMKHGVVGIAGLGGLGSHVAVSLARTGVGRLVGYDYDIVVPSNISRQYYFLEQIGLKKCDALKKTVSSITTLTKADFYDLKVTKDNAAELFKECDVIIEAFDDSAAKAMLFDVWQKYYPDKYYVGASGVAGYKDEPPLTIKKLSSKCFMVGDFMSENESLMAPRVSMAANMQANLAVKFLLEISA